MVLGPLHRHVLVKVAQRQFLEHLPTPEPAPLWLDDQGGAEARTALLSKVAEVVGETRKKTWGQRHPTVRGLGLAAGAAGLGAGGYLFGRHRGHGKGMGEGLKKGITQGMSEGLKKGRAQGIIEGAAQARKQVFGSSVGGAVNRAAGAVHQAAGVAERARGAAGKAKELGRDVLDIIRMGGKAARKGEKWL